MKTDTLITALRNFAAPYQVPATPSNLSKLQREIVLIVEEDGQRFHLPLSQACSIAADWLDNREMDGLKFRALVAEMRAKGYERLYEHLMREKMPE